MCAACHSLVERHPLPLVTEIFGVSLPTPHNSLKAWTTCGLIGLLGGHQAGTSAKLTAALLDTAEQIARASPCTLAQIDRRLREIHLDAPPFKLDCRSANLKKCGLTFTQTRLSLKENAAMNKFEAAREKPEALPRRGEKGEAEPVLAGRERFLPYRAQAHYSQCAEDLIRAPKASPMRPMPALQGSA